MRIKLEMAGTWFTSHIEYWSEGVGTFCPERASVRLLAAFPEAEIDSADQSLAEVRRVERNLRRSHAPAAIRRTMMRQIRRKARRNGPVHLFALRSNGRTLATGRIARYTVEFWAGDPLSPSLRRRIRQFLGGLRLGRPRVGICRWEPDQP